jgi:hypothetical protein
MVTDSNLPDVISKMLVQNVAEWYAAGLTRGQLRSLVRSGRLIRVWPAVYATRSAVKWAEVSPERRHALLVIAARASVGRDSVASHQSAALIHGLDMYPRPHGRIVLTRPPARRSGRRKSDGIFFHTAELPDDHVTRTLGARVTTVARTVVDIARASSFMSAVVTADSALHSALTAEKGSFTTKAALLGICDACARWPGIRNARLAADFADPRAESVLESCARVIFHEHGIEPPELQATITGPNFRYTVDFYWPRYRVVAEADGEVKYSDPRRAIRQLERDQQLRDHGEKVVHFTWRELFKTSGAVPDRIRRAFASPTPV